MLNDHRQQSVCDFLTLEFTQQCEALSETNRYYPEPRHPLEPIREELRQWGFVRFSGFKASHNTVDYDAQIVGQRSDGRVFRWYITWVPPTQLQSSQIEVIRERFAEALAIFKTFRDCSCGILGYQDIGEFNSDGDPVLTPIHNPCKLHRPTPVVLPTGSDKQC